jgi:diaminohydroxyphosphoribosylaminopyrimidine deaminase / 5-amino-6-(5-phosphoribosylamino)uracil reductase
MVAHSFYMQRCLELAAKAAGYTAPNPMVGAVLVHNDRIIGEGYHQVYGAAHAEVNCIKQAEQYNSHLVAESKLYVSLEPCAHFGKTPPCADLVIEKKIKEVYIGCRDPFDQVNGKGIEKLKAAGVAVTVGVLEEACRSLNKSFFTFHERKRPYIILKWAESLDKRIAGTGDRRLFISNGLSNRLVHKWRAETAAILVGTNTAKLDDPALTTRLWKGKNPLRLVVDMNLRLPLSLQLFDQSVNTIVFNAMKEEEQGSIRWVMIDKAQALPLQILGFLYKNNIQSVLIEGGAKLLQSFIDGGCWDEARVITNNKLVVGNGVEAPGLRNASLQNELRLDTDSIRIFSFNYQTPFDVLPVR